MKISIENIEFILDNNSPFSYLSFDREITSQIIEWSSHWGFRRKSNDSNLFQIPNGYNLSECFYDNKSQRTLCNLYYDSDNELDINDFYKLIIGNALIGIGVCESKIAILKKESTEDLFKEELYNHYKHIFHSLEELVFESNIKSGGHTSKDDINKYLKSNKIYSCLDYKTSHKGKMAMDVLDIISEEVQSCELSYNILLGNLIDASSESVEIVCSSKGLLISKVMSDFLSYGCTCLETNSFNSTFLQFEHARAIFFKSPEILFEAIVKHCQIMIDINESKPAKASEESRVFMSAFLEDLSYGMKALGMIKINNVKFES